MHQDTHTHTQFQKEALILFDAQEVEVTRFKAFGKFIKEKSWWTKQYIDLFLHFW